MQCKQFLRAMLQALKPFQSRCMMDSVVKEQGATGDFSIILIVMNAHFSAHSRLSVRWANPRSTSAKPFKHALSSTICTKSSLVVQASISNLKAEPGTEVVTHCPAKAFACREAC